MRQALTTLAALGLCAGLAACNQGGGGNGQAGAAPADTKAAEQGIKAEEAAELSDWQAKKGDALVAHYASDATFYDSGMASVTGHDKIKAAFDSFLKDPNFSLDYTNKGTVVAASGDLGYTKGTYRVTYTDPKTKQKASEDGSYITTFRKQADGWWKIVDDAAVAGPPASTAAPAKTPA